MGYRSKKEIAEGFPASVTLRFKSEAAKQFFMTGLCDGWGEGYVELFWPWRDGAQFDDVEMFGVVNTDGDAPDSETEPK